ncbi:MAG: DUF4910 domain-containing protein [Anaerolineales bacterium]|nr:DUF4910 domain-containing protein [Anaerolineales bacterium]
MKPHPSLKSILAEFFPLHRTLASDGQDKTLEIVGSYMPDSSNYAIETYAPLTPVWTWKVPERYFIHEAYLESEDGERIVDFKDNPLHIVSYSLPIDKVLSFDELQRGFKVATAVVHPQGGANPEAGEFLVQAHTCHPMQANDDGAGVVSAIELARRLAENPLPAGSMSVRFWFGPETIGTIAWLAHNESLIPNLRGGIFMEMTGNKNKIAWHHTRQHNHLLDRITNYQLRNTEHEARDFASAPANDERVINGPGVNVPCISLNRFPYDEYHTTDDNLDIIHEDMLVGAAQTAEDIVRIYASNYIPKRAFRGPVFLSGHGLWVDWRDNWALNRAIEKIMMRFEGEHTIFDIAEQVGLDYFVVREYVEKFRAKGFVTPLPIPSEAQDS